MNLESAELPASDVARLANILGWEQGDIAAEHLEACPVFQCPECGRWTIETGFCSEDCTEIWGVRLLYRRKLLELCALRKFRFCRSQEFAALLRYVQTLRGIYRNRIKAKFDSGTNS